MRQTYDSRIQIEGKVNALLQLGLKAYFAEKKKGHADFADQILALSSGVAHNFLLVNDFYSTYEKVVCGCGRQLRTGNEIEFYKNAGECMSCDSLRGEYLDFDREEIE